ncbi:McrC family protein [Ramlibacter sp. WS9]|uniref:McrC family protein n=1 Tax=Ramlibacter sp. WS9 TaxID=1882741 RepID=UPI001142F622|nr:hypothetical protein [Ramlibacter sp. WS9]ROZ78773.1 hypothetical protein EEB15_03525 [Ramlibacter sp. WS9]
MNTARLDISLSEWSSTGPLAVAPSVQEAIGGNPALLDALGDRLVVAPGFRGLEVTSTSFVGRVDVGALRISIKPKIDQTPLTRLLKYAYGLRDLSLLDSQSMIDIEHGGLQELLIALLVEEAEALCFAGLHRIYQHRTDRLESLRGRLDTTAITRRGVLLDSRLPCRFFDRTPNWLLNQVLLTGLQLTLHLTEDLALRRRVEQTTKFFQGVERLRNLTLRDIRSARVALTRMTDRAAPALDLIQLLLEGRGMGFDQDLQIGGSSFLFDMNRFFQRLLSRFLHDHLVTARIADESSIKQFFKMETALRKRRTPTPRPDFGVFNLKGELLRYLDAKYRDLWRTSLPAEWLYQLSAYALASPSRSSVLLYPTMSNAATDESILMSDPITGNELGAVVLRPIQLGKLGALLGRPGKDAHEERTSLAMSLIVDARDDRNG